MWTENRICLINFICFSANQIHSKTARIDRLKTKKAYVPKEIDAHMNVELDEELVLLSESAALPWE